MRNKTVLITGASSGLGLHLAQELGKQGANLALFSRTQKQTAPFLTICGDTTKPEDCKRAIEQTIDTFGSLDYLILNAGISMWARFEDVLDVTHFKTLIETNYLGAVYFTHYALPHLKKTNGLITAIASIQGKIPVPYHTGYAASKHALHGFFETLRAEEEVDILLVSPSWIQGTDIHTRSVIRNKTSHQNGGLRLEDCGREILSAMKKRKRELILPKYYKILPWLKLLCPNFLNHCISKAIQKRL